MTADVLKIYETPSKVTGGTAIIYCLKGLEDMKSYRSWVDKSFRNYSRWENVRVGDTLQDLKIKKGNLIDADSQFRKVIK